MWYFHYDLQILLLILKGRNFGTDNRAQHYHMLITGRAKYDQHAINYFNYTPRD